MKLPDNKTLVLQSKDLTMPEDQSTARWTDCRVELAVQDLEAAVNLPRGQESILWVDCSVFDVTADRYITSDFTVSTPLLVGTDQEGKVVKVDGDGVLARMAQSHDPKTRDLMLDAAEVSAARSKAALPALLAALKDADEVHAPLRHPGASAAPGQVPSGRQGRRRRLPGGATDKDVWVRLYAADGLWDAEKTEDVVAAAIGLLKEPEIASHAEDLLVKVGRPAVPALSQGARRRRRRVPLERRGSSAPRRGREQGRRPRPYWRTQEDLGGRRRRVQDRRHAGKPVRRGGAKSGDAVPALMDGLKDGEKRLQPTLVRALGQVGPDAGAAVDALARLLKDEDANSRRDVIVALGRIGPGAKAAIPALGEIMKEQDGRVRIDAASAVWSIDKSDAALAVLLEAVRDRDEGIRRRALQALANVGSDGKGAFEAVARVLHEDGSRDVRLDAIFALKSFGRRAVSDLLQALKDGPKADRNMILVTLGEMGDKAQDAVPAVVESLNDSDEFVHAAAASALKKLDPEAARKAGVN